MILPTWGGRTQFEYTGSVQKGTTITFGKKNNVKVTAEQYANMLKHFCKKPTTTFPVGTSRDNPPVGSLGEWLQKYVTKTAIASYVAPILIHEKYASREGDQLKIEKCVIES